MKKHIQLLTVIVYATFAELEDTSLLSTNECLCGKLSQRDHAHRVLLEKFATR